MSTANDLARNSMVLWRAEVIKEPLVDLEFLGLKVQDFDNESPVWWSIIGSERSKDYSLPNRQHISLHVS